MIRSTVIIEDEDGIEHKGDVISNFSVDIDHFVTIELYNGRYAGGYIIELLGESNDE